VRGQDVGVRVDRVVEGDVVAQLVAELRDEPGFDERVGRGVDAQLALGGRLGGVWWGWEGVGTDLPAGEADGDDAEFVVVREELGAEGRSGGHGCGW
jgi:hypothetical protein